ncbi:succinate dehydrogenase assembly factor 2 [Candidatus Pelagibacter sp.]|jgi:antitoxin CptB|nr:succinate dehydrogenase assembly factor 2 [Candidatus Pelagibacter sp.]MDC1196591.1 succinate dehydrogenase assembly factor 2 [Pelagibacteraceae bacterium]MDB9792008.1 succinate dehydrogenase assembly factor 2 [Candidatus Pelagibacter sp.]MDB9812468.1 succinate dehydrogenase assembly factor 2 [Candidatus Pelagibacter sp.]MDB9819650.1 succinate dehydrogenase assembly factor 2 [Candidatus Pelagibacter sp.]
MTINIKDLKNKIIYRANYRGTKEMDKLLGSFTKKYIDQFNEQELKFLCDLLDYDDENLYRFNQGQNLTIQIKLNKVSEIFKNYKYVCE